MNAKKFHVILILVLAVLFANTAVVRAYPAEAPEFAPTANELASCPAVVAGAEERLARMDIPSRWADYYFLDQFDSCQVVSGVSTIPVTGSRAEMLRQRWEEFKIQQADEMSH